MKPTILVTAAFLLAGCAGTPNIDPTETGFIEPGSVAGVVVDQAIRPVAGANITLTRGEPVTQMTDANGTFHFRDLAPGAYVLTAEKQGYLAVTTQAEVRSGESGALVQVQLERILEDLPSIISESFRGFLTCGVHDGVHDGTDCGLVERANDIIICEILGVCTEPPLPDQATFLSTVASRPDWVHTELVWMPTNQFGDRMEIMQFVNGPNGEDAGYLVGAEGPSPLVAPVTPENITEFDLWGENHLYYQIRVGPPAGTGATVTFQQDFQFFVFSFFNFQPDPAWVFARDGPYPLPEILVP